ncbi:archease [Patescibacteria group bacterium]|nr:archease [Patescibacteria group bacterium]
MKDYELLEHTADLKIRAYGQDLKEVFSNMLKGMSESIQPVVSGQSPIVNRKVNIKSKDLESLLINFLSEALYLSDVNNEVYFKAEFKILTDKELKGKIKGKKFNSLQTEIKAVTWHDLEVKKIDDQWQAIVLFDI